MLNSTRGMFIVAALFALAVPVWLTWLSWFVLRGSLGLLGFLGNVLGTPLTGIVVAGAVAAWFSDIAHNHKALIAVIAAATVFARVTFLMMF